MNRTEHVLQSATRALRNGEETARERYRGHQWFDDAACFCENYDENCFDPDYSWLPMEHFAPMLHEVFGREPVFD